MAFKKILVPTDGSEYTKASIFKAVELAKIVGASITALYVVDQNVFGNVPFDASVTAIYNKMEMEGKNATSFVEKICKENNIEVDEKIISGGPVKTIVEESKNYDLIVMGTLGRTGFSKLMMGSVAERVIRYAKCPVLVVKSPEVMN